MYVATGPALPPCRVLGVTTLQTKRDEFRAYLNKYGVAETFFERSEFPTASDFHVLATAGYLDVGFEFNAKLFFLPAPTEAEDFTQLATDVTSAILSYRGKRTVEIPPWLDSFKFEAEKALDVRKAGLERELAQVATTAEEWGRYKSILVTSGETLRQRVTKIFEKFFGFNVDPTDEGREDFKLLTDDEEVLAFCEVKGTKTGIKREYVNQIDGNRELRGFPPEVPGVLIINNEMSIASADERLKTEVALDQIQLARNKNILIVRTIDLLNLMRQVEHSDSRGETLLGLIRSGGGWLSADEHGHTIV